MKGFREILRLWIIQTNTETDSKNFTFYGKSLSGDEYFKQLSIPNSNLDSIVFPDVEGGIIDKFGLSNVGNMFGINEGLFMKDLRISQDSVDGTAQTINVYVMYYE